MQRMQMSVVLVNDDSSREGRWFRVNSSYGCVLENVCCNVAMMTVDCLISKQKFTNSLWTVNKKLLRKQTQVGIQRFRSFWRCSHKSKRDKQLLVYFNIAETINENIICIKVNWFLNRK